MITTLRQCALILLVLIAFAVPALADEAKPAADPARIAAARDLMQVTGVTRQLEGMMDAMKQGFAKGAANAPDTTKSKQATEEFNTFLDKFMSYREAMLNDFAELYAENFTAEEMKTVADFYRSGTGAKFIAMTPALMQRGAAIGMKYSQKILEEAKAAKPQ